MQWRGKACTQCMIITKKVSFEFAFQKYNHNFVRVCIASFPNISIFTERIAKIAKITMNDSETYNILKSENL